MAQLQGWNRLSSTQIAVGKKLVVAGKVETAQQQNEESSSVLRKVVHKVRVGETLNKIASVYKTTVNAIRSWNKEDDLRVLHQGISLQSFLGTELGEFGEFGDGHRNSEPNDSSVRPPNCPNFPSTFLFRASNAVTMEAILKRTAQRVHDSDEKSSSSNRLRAGIAKLLRN